MGRKRKELDNPRRKTILRTILFVVAAVLLFAYAFEVTEVNLAEPLRPQRQANLVSLIRELARPDFFDFDEETRSTNLSIRMPCPELIRGSQVTSEERVVLMAPNCATTTQDVLSLTGQGFPANVQGVVRWYPAGATTTRTLTPFRADAEGNFTVNFTMPDIRETEEPQRIEVIEVVGRRLEGFSDTTVTTFERIIETILMALMASTVGTILAVPISFLAARNLMENVNLPLASITAALLVMPFAWWLGNGVSAGLVGLAGQIAGQPMIGVGALVVAAALTWPVLRMGSPLFGEESPTRMNRLVSIGRLLVVGLLAFFSFSMLAHLGIQAGLWLEPRLGFFGFLGNFVSVLSDLTRLLLPYLFGLAGALVAASLASKYAQEAVMRLGIGPARLFTFVMTVLGVSTFVFLLVYGLNWICFLDMCSRLPQDQSTLWQTLAVPAGVVGLAAGLLSLLRIPKKPFPIGFIIYTITRSTLNLLRAIEPLIMGAVFVVWVGIGPFAGIMALILHSIADLGKLFSEQVENISDGPLEAITATGANRIQMIVFAVIPQITPHYIAFAFYRWDINVRMSTIIGFIGGGGIGLVLQRAANLTQYSQASVMIIAIAVVVIILDYLSSRLRSRII
jgi:phosphonate ABC transporter permease subunit PhnE